MFRQFFVAAVFVALSVLGRCDSVFAQLSPPTDPKPRGVMEGYTGQALRSLYQQDIGQGFSSMSQNSLALQQSQNRVPYVGQTTTSSSASSSPVAAPTRSARIGLGVSSSRASKPFSSVSSTPTVSPYLNLFREDLGGNDDLNYQTLVRPQIQQQQVNQQFERETLELSRRVQSISAQSAYRNPAGSEQQYPTGHQTVFMYYGHYYPSAARQQRRR